MAKAPRGNAGQSKGEAWIGAAKAERSTAMQRQSEQKGLEQSGLTKTTKTHLPKQQQPQPLNAEVKK